VPQDSNAERFAVCGSVGMASPGLEAPPCENLDAGFRSRSDGYREARKFQPDFGFLSLLASSDSPNAGKHRERLFFADLGSQVDRELRSAMRSENVPPLGTLARSPVEGPTGPGKPSWRATIIQLGLHYYFPCRSRNHLVAVVGVGKTVDGEFLWEEDVALLETLAGYLAVGIENANLAQSLVAKASQFERLQQFSENILESINVGLLAVDLEDRIEAANTPLMSILPIRLQESVDDLRGKKLADVLPPDLAQQLDHLRDDGGIHNIYRYRVRDGNGNGSDSSAPVEGGLHAERGSAPEERVLNIAVAPLLSKDCDWIGRLIIFDDVTDRVALEGQLAQAEKLSSVGLLAAAVAHEVNTPLTVISTQAQMLAKQMGTGDKNFKSLEKIIRQTFRASEIVNSLLNFSRTKGATFAPLDINKIITETLLLLDHQFKLARIQVESDLEPSAPQVSGSSDKLQQVFLNLFLNAKDAMPEGGRLRVATRTGESILGIEISDTGIGIPPEHLHRIYDPFFTTKGSGRGTGLGLAVSYGIVHEHGGKIHVESRPGLGTTFRLEFPVMRKPVHA